MKRTPLVFSIYFLVFFIFRVLADGIKSKELFDMLGAQAVAALENDFKEKDVDSMVKIYEQLGLKGNVPQDIIDHIDK